VISVLKPHELSGKPLVEYSTPAVHLTLPEATVTTEQLITVISGVLTNLLTCGGFGLFLFYVIRGLRREIASLKVTISQQDATFKVMEKRVEETEKVGDIYRTLIDDLPEQVTKYKSFVTKMKDDVIQQYEQAQDETVKESRKVELQRLELQEKMLSELPKLREELISTLQGIEQRVNAINPPHRSVWPEETGKGFIFVSARQNRKLSAEHYRPLEKLLLSLPQEPESPNSIKSDEPEKPDEQKT
jgi:TolA-binding protein